MYLYLFIKSLFLSFLQDANPVLKASLQRSEDTAYWLRQKTDDLMEATNLKEPLKRLDAAAAQSIVNVEKKTFQVKKNLYYFLLSQKKFQVQ